MTDNTAISYEAPARETPVLTSGCRRLIGPCTGSMRWRTRGIACITSWAVSSSARTGSPWTDDVPLRPNGRLVRILDRNRPGIEESIAARVGQGSAENDVSSSSGAA